jgi:ATP-binding cassette subfamily C exporter for protease/lipase
MSAAMNSAGATAGTPALPAPAGRPLPGPGGPQAAASLSSAAPQAAPRGFLGGPVGQMLRTFKGEFFWLCVFSMFANLLLLVPTLYMLQVFDRVMLSGNVYTLVALTVVMVALMLVLAFSEWVRSRLLVRSGARFDEALNRRVFAAAFSAQLATPQRSPQQPLADMNQVRQFLTGNGVFAIVDTPWAVVFIVVLFLMHPWLGWMSLGFVLVQLTLGFTVQRLSQKTQKIQQEQALDSGQYLQAKLRNAETVEGMGMQANLRRQWMALHEKQTQSHHQVQETSHRVQALMKFVQYTQQALMLSLGALLAIDGKITAGAMVASNALMGNALRPIGVIVQSWGQSAQARAAFARLNALLQAYKDEPTSAPASQVAGQITLRDLKAMAPGRKEPILKGLNVEFKAGEVIGILGPSGAGKSTLARCLLGIWPQTEGQVLLDGHPLTAWPRAALGPHLGYLPQDIELFEGTIADNIARFSDVDPSVVIAAAQRAGIHEMILRQPRGYDTTIGEAGGTLSGGQRQRLGLARALLGEPAVVVLDEPSANLDDMGEAALLRAVQDLKRRGSTVFMIVHQPQLLSVADRVLVLEAGQIKQLVARPVEAPATPGPAGSPAAAAGTTAPATAPAAAPAPATRKPLAASSFSLSPVNKLAP